MNRTEAAAECLRELLEVAAPIYTDALTVAIAALEAPAVLDDSVVLTEDDLDDMRRNLGNLKPALTPAMQAAIDVRSAMVAAVPDAPAPRGCICPPTSEQTCQGWSCPRKPIGWNKPHDQ